MLYTREWVAEKYDEVNEKYFGGQLPPFSSVSFKLTMSRKEWGTAAAGSWTKDWNTRTYVAHNPVLELSNYYDSDEWVKLNTLVHEMVHLYEFFVEPTYVQKYILTGRHSKEYPAHGHGVIFFREAERLKQYGFDIQRYVTQEKKNASRLSDVIQQRLDKKNAKGFSFIVGTLKEPGKSSSGGLYPIIYTPVNTGNYNEKLRQMASRDCARIDKYISHNPRAEMRAPSGNRFFMMDSIDSLKQYYSFEFAENILGAGGNTNIVSRDDILHLLDEYSRDVATMITEYILKKNKQKYDDWRGYIIPQFTMTKKLDGHPLKFKINYGYRGIDKGGIIWLKLSEGQWGTAAEAISYANDGDNYMQEAIDNVEDDIWKSLAANGQERPQPQVKPQTFRIKTSKGTVDIEFTDKNELSNKLRERFPKLSDEAMQKLMDNPSNYVQNEGISLFGQIVTEVLGSIGQDAPLGISREEFEQLPDELPGIMVIN